MPKRLTKEEFIEKSKIAHGDKYDYSKVEYKNNSTKVCIICPEHGEFWQSPNSHMNGNGCPKCSKQYMDTEYFIECAKKIHGNKYDYSKVEYINAKTKICIICPEHGEFWQKPNGHLNGYGCPKCGKKTAIEKLKIGKDKFIQKSIESHGGEKYDYSQVVYVSTNKMVDIICPKHGVFKQTPYNHIRGGECPFCTYERLSMERLNDTNEWIEKAKKVHHERYTYDRAIYKGYNKKITITCPIHGDFEQMAYDHLQGKGCPKCRKSKMEIDISLFLDENNIKYEEQYRPKFLNIGKSRLSLDFYLPEYSIGIECQGAQHFIGNTFYSKNIEAIVKRDILKKELCEKNGIKMLYYTDLKKFANSFENLYISKEKLLEAILNERLL